MYYYILNPSSGGGRINKIQNKLKTRLKELGIAGEFEKSIGPGDVTKLTKIGIEKGFKTIVAVGGDGTINETINGIGTNDVALGIIPIGKSNELAKTLGIPDWEAACNILAARKIEEVDLGRVRDHFFVTSVNIGFEAETANLKPEEPSIMEKLKFYKDSLKWAASYRPQTAALNFDDSFLVETDFFNIQVSNSQFSKDQKALPQDNMLDVFIISKMKPTKALKYALRSKGPNEGRGTKVSVFRTKRVTIKTKKPMDVAIDGRIATKTPVTCELAQRKLKVIVSKKRKF